MPVCWQPGREEGCRLNSFTLKLIAMVTMVIDHVGAIIFPNDLIFRFIGRLSFPIFCFCIAQGLIHTHNRRRYLSRLFIFALISQIPFALAFHHTIIVADTNVLFTFALAVLGISLYENPLFFVDDDMKTGLNATGMKWIGVVFMAACVWSANLIHSDYGAFGVLLVILFYFTATWKHKTARIVAAFLMMCGYGVVSGALLVVKPWSDLFFAASWKMIDTNTDALTIVLRQTAFWSVAACAVLFICFYNQKRGPASKWLFYIFYPAHLLVLYLISISI